MSQLGDFESKDFIEQVSLMGSLAQNKSYESIPEIIGLFEKISRHDAIGLVIRDTVKSLFAGSEDHTALFLESQNPEVQRICIEVAGQKAFESTGDALLRIADKAIDRKDYGLLFAVITSLSQVQPPAALDLFKRCMDYEDPLVSSQCIEILGAAGDVSSTGRMCEIVSEAETNTFGGECDLPAASAIRALARIKDKEAVSFLASKVHHLNPAARRLIHQELVNLGPSAVPALASVFQHGDVDEKILAADVLGRIGTREAGDTLVKALDKGLAPHPNIRFSIYEALGKIPGMTSLVCLADALEETDEMVLIAVASSLDTHLNPWIVEKISGTILAEKEHGAKLAKAVIASRSLNIFESLYAGNETVAALLIGEVRDSRDEELTGLFREKLQSMPSDRAVSDARALAGVPGKTGGRHILAVDDSRAMLNFYRSVASSMGMKISVAENGKEALDILSGSEKPCLVITDMNMPVMDGIEFIDHVRCMPGHADIPILMSTTESESSQEDLARQAGATGFIRKPFSAEKLQEIIRQHLS